mmetsp:Transcript_25562/g.41960  ORF Transcript_25562/g.41960 Transcript_25562/m.41960 type:complete len:536 (-) Transcript_25562:311-1918(-)
MISTTHAHSRRFLKVSLASNKESRVAVCHQMQNRLKSRISHTAIDVEKDESISSVATASRTVAPDPETSQAEIERLFNLQQQNQYGIGRMPVEERISKLHLLQDAVWSAREDIQQAVYKDKGNHPAEVDLMEIYPVTKEIKHVTKHLKKWAKPRRVSTPWSLLGTSSWIHVEPKGVTMVMSPWNFPISLTLGPLVSAVAAGNTCILKPSEMSPHSSAVLRKIVEETFDAHHVAVVEGGVQTSTDLLEQPFNHIFFTGAPSLGKIVMTAAAKHLSSVTLELGGKSPTIVDETANLDAAAKRIAWAKTLNSGQICIAPDYVFVHEFIKDEFIAKYKDAIATFYGENPQESSAYSQIINPRHHRRLKSVLDDALKLGAKLEMGGRTDHSSKYFEPTLLSNVDPNSIAMQDEIFGPILPLVTFQSIDEVITRINSKEKPLAMYIYSSDDANCKHLIDGTRAGATCINQSMLHFGNDNLPFGGINHSGIGKSHGIYGFKEFSNERAVLKQWSPLAGSDFMTAPYNTKIKRALVDITMRFF